jgi:hypothetical protein
MSKCLNAYTVDIRNNLSCCSTKDYMPLSKPTSMTQLVGVSKHSNI